MFFARLAISLTILVTSFFPAVAAADADAGHVVISEIQTGTSASASQEFVELYNPTDNDQNLSGWTAEYKSATSANTTANWTKRAALSGSIPAHGFYLIASKTYLPTADADWTATLAGSGGHVRIKDSNGTVIDRVGYGSTANAAEGAPAPAPANGQSIERLPGRLDPLAGDGIDTDNNSADFVLRSTSEPQSSAAPIEDGADDSAPADQPITDPAPADDSGAPVVESYAQIRITELLPNPMSPLTDAHDEYIELYNPGDTAADLTGYELLTGKDFHDRYVLPATTLAPGAYTALYASQTKLSLVNTGGTVKLLDPLGDTVDQTAYYGEAAEGQAWALVDGVWQWTLQTTPANANLLVAPVLPPAAVKSAAVKKPKVVSAARPKAAKVKKVAAKKKPKAKKLPKTQLAAAQIKPPVTAISAAPWLIGTLILLTIGYAAYEFRHDVQRYYYKLRSHRRSG